LDSIAKVVQVKPLPVVAALGGDTCVGKPLSLSASGGTSYLWTPATGLSSATVSNPIATPLVSTDYSVLITDVNGCTGNVNVPVTIYGPVTTEIKDTIINIGDSVLIGLDLGTNYTYSWNPIIGLSCTTCATPYAQPLVNTTYVVTMADKEGCYSGISRYTIEINPNVTIDVPTGFTPDGDGVNDIIFVDGWGIKQLLEYKIYNRWGQLMFETTDIKKGWDGYYRGKLQNVETYVYTAKAITYNEGKIITKKGSFNLIR
jgi:gliding motility-associated-like protein